MRIFACDFESTNAGPSPNNNERIELFLSGCKKAADGNPCDGCFNYMLWNKNSGYKPETPTEVYNMIKKSSDNKYITFVGGEPMDQADELLELCNMLKQDNYNIIIITHHDFIKEILDSKYADMADIWIDGEYKKDLRIYDMNKKDSIHNVIGSSNQNIYIKRNNLFFKINAANLKSWKFNNGVIEWTTFS